MKTLKSIERIFIKLNKKMIFSKINKLMITKKNHYNTSKDISIEKKIQDMAPKFEPNAHEKEESIAAPEFIFSKNLKLNVNRKYNLNIRKEIR
jgi:hypothetical protein